MQTIDWGKCWNISKLCFGTLPMGPLQKNLSPEDGGRLIRDALEKGVTFLDTAQVYKTYPHIRTGLEDWPGQVYIASKSTAKTYQEMKDAVQEARSQLNMDCIHIFHLHAARVTPEVFTERAGALEYLKEARAKNHIGRIGIATHSVSVVGAAADNQDIEVIFPLINKEGIGILNGNRGDMEKAIKKAQKKGKLIYAMKVFAGGNLLNSRQEALDYVLKKAGVDVVALGMVSKDELLVNLALLKGECDEEILKKAPVKDKKLVIQNFCNACQTCLSQCPNNALYIEDEQCHVREEDCILCGYCGPACPQFAIRMI